MVPVGSGLFLKIVASLLATFSRSLPLYELAFWICDSTLLKFIQYNPCTMCEKSDKICLDLEKHINK
uniref:Uncharacterized protein n=1 Tax=Aegilops tauschii subsp. strangulata TaxID=200361 RepID=A0A452Z555_AEGTS